jgi:hypothetical protein
MAVIPVYEVVCDCCGMADYIHGCSNKKELAVELTARGYIVKGNCTSIFCDENCAATGKT